MPDFAERREWRYADFDVHPTVPRLMLAVQEKHGPIVENVFGGDRCQGRKSAIVLQQFHVGSSLIDRPPDFVDSARFSPDGKRVIARGWCVLFEAAMLGSLLTNRPPYRWHPYMSFEASELWSADVEVIDRGFGPELRTVNERRIAGDRNTTAIGDPK